MGQITPNGQVQALVALDNLRQSWREIMAAIPIRLRAEELVERFPLTTGDALQLAAAWIWCDGHPRNRVVISGDRRLLEVAGQLGFATIGT